MRLLRNPIDAALFSALLFPYLSSANNIDCTNVVTGDVSFDLRKLGGPKSVMHSVDEGATFTNTTYTIDICAPLKPKSTKSSDRCPIGTRLCAIERLINLEDKKDMIKAAYPIAGALDQVQGGKPLDAKWTLLRKSPSNEDSKKEGLSLEVHGGFRKTDGFEKNGKPQKAIIEFLCDKNREGTENLIDPEDKYEAAKAKREEPDKKEGEGEDSDEKSSSLQFVRYDTQDKDIDILRLSWRTKYACEDTKRSADPEKKGGWGFFTWFILIAFLSTATYLIFGSWLNYNRYGARGWDLLPHGDTIRDVPYLVKDWSRRVVNSVQGGGSRGGYAAV